MEKKIISEHDEFTSNGKSTEETKFLKFEIERKGRGPKLGKRHQQMLLLFSLLFISFCVKVSITIAMVAMTDTSTESGIPVYNWTNKNVIISAFFWGYIIPQIGAGWLATHYGPKKFLIGSMAISSLAGFLVPASAAHFGYVGVMICRAIQGLCQGFVFPSAHMLVARWVPQSERSTVSSLVYAGGPSGTTLAILITGYISASSYGWPMSFYFFNGLGLFWTVCYTFWGYNTPADHPTISEEEKYYIESFSGCDEAKKETVSMFK
ncbi:hypothetical protein JTB14_033776 [Gonioctena quinquepunctata]|nr:hypothetical protein JTB14_033776 [Gonioctena quinquepunctata]